MKQLYQTFTIIKFTVSNISIKISYFLVMVLLIINMCVIPLSYLAFINLLDFI